MWKFLQGRIFACSSAPLLFDFLEGNGGLWSFSGNVFGIAIWAVDKGKGGKRKEVGQHGEMRKTIEAYLLAYWLTGLLA